MFGWKQQKLTPYKKQKRDILKGEITEVTEKENQAFRGVETRSSGELVLEIQGTVSSQC